MSKRSSLSRFVAFLVLIALLASPLATVAQEMDSVTVQDSSVAAPDGQSNPVEGNPEEGTSEAGNLEEGVTEEGALEEGATEEDDLEEGVTEEDNLEEGVTEEGNLEEGATEEGNLEEGATEEGNLDDPVTNDEVSLVAEPGTGDPAFYCNFQNQPAQGDVATWWATNNVAPDCIDLSIVNSPESCSLSASFTSQVYSSVSGQPFAYRDLLYWFETDANGVVLRPAGGGAPLNWGNSGPSGPGQGGGFTLSFPEDYNGGTAYVLINFASPENQIAPGLDQIDLDHWRATSAGVRYAINTDCEDPIPVDYCDYSQLVGAGDVYNWLLNAPEGADTDCIDVGEPVQSCGTLNIPFTERVEPFTYVLLWAIGTEIPADDSLWNSTWPITFPEDFNGGSVDVIVFIGGPEDDYYHFAGEDPYPYPYPNQDRGDIPAGSLGGGKTFTILTDCIQVVTPELPVLVPGACKDVKSPVLPTLTVPVTEGITYGAVTSTPADANRVKLNLTATANAGFTFAGATMPAGWTLVSDSEAVYELIADKAECPVTPDTPKPKPEDKPKAPEVTQLPSTGSGSNPDSMIGLAAATGVIAAIALAFAFAGAGHFFTSRKR